MKTLFIGALLALPLISTASAYQPTGTLNLDGVKVTPSPEPTRIETTETPRPSGPTVVPLPPVEVAPPTDGEGITPVFLEIGGVEGDSGEAKGNVDKSWKVEEGEKLRGVEPDEIDFQGDSENATNFAILLGSGSDNDDEERAQGLERALTVLEENARASDQAIESVSLNFEKITTRVKEDVRLFGIIPMTATAEVDIDAEQNVSVRFPWWTILTTGDDEASVGERIYTTISNVLKTKHDSIKSALGNVR